MQVSITSETAWSRAFMQVHLQVLRLQSLVRDPTAYLRQRDRAGAQLRAEKTKTPIPSEFTLRACLLCFMADALRAMKSISGTANTTL